MWAKIFRYQTKPDSQLNVEPEVFAVQIQVDPSQFVMQTLHPERPSSGVRETKSWISMVAQVDNVEWLKQREKVPSNDNRFQFSAHPEQKINFMYATNF